MSERKPFLLRLDPGLHTALQRWAADDLRSLNAQIEYVLRRSLREAGRGPDEPAPTDPELPSDDGTSTE
ncbi:MAG: hypothetical protein V4503_09910 [Gemmatimonadota bacterium]